MKLHFANCTDQVQVVNVRLPEKKNFFVQTIDVGRQVIIAATQMSRPDIDMIVEQQGIYGVRAGDDFTLARESQLYVPILYSVDTPVPFEVQMRAVKHNRGVLQSRGKRLREEAAIATSINMRERSPNAADTLSMSVQEDRPGTVERESPAPLNEGVRMGFEVP